jgi:hypothetical protein
MHFVVFIPLVNGIICKNIMDITMAERLQSLVDFCKSNGRVCPQPVKWNELWQMLPDRKRAGTGWQPPVPLILAAWSETSTEAKQQRLKEHLVYAEQRGILGEVERFLRNLPEDNWFHESD